MPITLASKSFPGVSKQYNFLFQSTLSHSSVKLVLKNKMCVHVHFKNVLLKSAFYTVEKKLPCGKILYILFKGF